MYSILVASLYTAGWYGLNVGRMVVAILSTIWGTYNVVLLVWKLGSIRWRDMIMLLRYELVASLPNLLLATW